MIDHRVEIVVAGHICLDIIPSLDGVGGGLAGLLVPGRLVNVGAAVTATGGTVSNAGLALHRLGVPVGLMGKVGDDLFGRAVLYLLRRQGPHLADGMIVRDDEPTSYSVVISPPGVDRIFLHCPGANDTFSADDIDYRRLDGARLFHFGYPPIMRRMFEDGGSELADMLGRVRDRGLTTSLDMSLPDPASPSGRADWPAILRRSLPRVDLFAPSIDEILFMLDRPRFERMLGEPGSSDVAGAVTGELLGATAATLIEMGAALVALKLGDRGLYLRTTPDRDRLVAAGAAAPADLDAWRGRELLSTCFQADLVGTTGSGDCTIAGLLLGLTRGFSPEQALTAAVAVGACSVEAADATTGVVPWPDIQRRLGSGWRRHRLALPLPGWRLDEPTGLHVGPSDAGCLA